VLTTGGTLRACASALSAAGSQSVSALVFARTPAGRHRGGSGG
jgi:predicted amidophosphoribosyltransferase